MNIQANTLCKCDDCGQTWRADGLAPIRDLGWRYDGFGAPVPAGECPDKKCGALCYVADSQYDKAANLDPGIEDQLRAAHGRIARLELEAVSLRALYDASISERGSLRAALREIGQLAHRVTKT